MPAKAVAKPKPVAPAARGFTTIVVLSPGEALTAAEAELKLRTAAVGLALPPVVRVSDLEATPAAMALALYRAWRAVGRGAPALYLCAGQNPGRAEGGALSVMTTDWGNTVLAPNDGSLGLLVRLFAERHIPHTLKQLDIDAVVAAEQARMQNPEWQPAPDFALRDLLAPAAALLATRSGRLESGAPLAPLVLPFAEGSRTLRLKLHDAQPGLAVPVGPHRYLLNLTLDPLAFDQLLDDSAEFRLEMPGVRAPCPLTRLFRSPTAGMAADSALSGRGRRAGTLGLDGTLAPAWDERFLALTLHPRARPSRPGPLPLTLIRVR
jgi:hypothetical protein